MTVIGHSLLDGWRDIVRVAVRHWRFPPKPPVPLPIYPHTRIAMCEWCGDYYELTAVIFPVRDATDEWSYDLDAPIRPAAQDKRA